MQSCGLPTATDVPPTPEVAPPIATSEPIDWTPAPGLAILEPQEGAYFGVNLDWGNDSAAAFNERLGVGFGTDFSCATGSNWRTIEH